MRNWDIEFDREDKKLFYTRANCSKEWDPNLSPNHKNRNILQEMPWPRILANVTTDQNLSDQSTGFDVNNNADSTQNNQTNNTTIVAASSENNGQNSNFNLLFIFRFFGYSYFLKVKYH